jgi:hypothetical protein
VSKRLKQSKECAYCGEIKITTKDHVVPQCLFEKPLPSNMITVEACVECNSLKAKDDDYFRDYLLSDFSTSNYSKAQRLFSSKTIRSIGRNSSTFAKQIRQSKFVRHNIYDNEVVEIETDLTRLDDLLKRIVKGLFYAAKKKRMPNNISIDTKRTFVTKEGVETLWNLVRAGTYSFYKCGDGDVFFALRAFVSECEYSFNWYLVFYQNICVEVNTGLLIIEE